MDWLRAGQSIKEENDKTRKARNVENTRLRLVSSTFPSCSQMPDVIYRSVIYGLGFFMSLNIFKFNCPELTAV